MLRATPPSSSRRRIPFNQFGRRIIDGRDPLCNKEDLLAEFQTLSDLVDQLRMSFYSKMRADFPDIFQAFAKVEMFLASFSAVLQSEGMDKAKRMLEEVAQIFDTILEELAEKDKRSPAPLKAVSASQVASRVEQLLTTRSLLGEFGELTSPPSKPSVRRSRRPHNPVTVVVPKRKASEQKEEELYTPPAPKMLSIQALKQEAIVRQSLMDRSKHKRRIRALWRHMTRGVLEMEREKELEKELEVEGEEKRHMAEEDTISRDIGFLWRDLDGILDRTTRRVGIAELLLEFPALPVPSSCSFASVLVLDVSLPDGPNLGFVPCAREAIVNALKGNVGRLTICIASDQDWPSHAVLSTLDAVVLVCDPWRLPQCCCSHAVPSLQWLRAAYRMLQFLKERNTLLFASGSSSICLHSALCVPVLEESHSSSVQDEAESAKAVVKAQNAVPACFVDNIVASPTVVLFTLPQQVAASILLCGGALCIETLERLEWTAVASSEAAGLWKRFTTALESRRPGSPATANLVGIAASAGQVNCKYDLEGVEAVWVTVVLHEGEATVNTHFQIGRGLRLALKTFLRSPTLLELGGVDMAFSLIGSWPPVACVSFMQTVECAFAAGTLTAVSLAGDDMPALRMCRKCHPEWRILRRFRSLTDVSDPAPPGVGGIAVPAPFSFTDEAIRGFGAVLRRWRSSGLSIWLEVGNELPRVPWKQLLHQLWLILRVLEPQWLLCSAAVQPGSVNRYLRRKWRLKLVPSDAIAVPVSSDTSTAVVVETIFPPPRPVKAAPAAIEGGSAPSREIYSIFSTLANRRSTFDLD